MSAEFEPWAVLLQQGPLATFFGALLLGARNLWTTVRPGVMKILDESYNFMVATKEAQRVNSESFARLTQQHEQVVKLVENHGLVLTEIRNAVTTKKGGEQP